MPRLAELLAGCDGSRLTRITASTSSVHDSFAESLDVSMLLSALQDESYVCGVLERRRPPVLALMRHLLAAPGAASSLEEMRTPVMEETERFCRLVSGGELLGGEPRVKLYRRLLTAAWQSDLSLDASETRLLGLLRHELGMVRVEHFLMMHHREIRSFWWTASPFDTVVGSLLDHGILFAVEGSLVIPQEVVPLVRAALGIPLTDPQARRLYTCLSNEELRDGCGRLELRTSGSKQDLVDRLVTNLAPADEILTVVGIHALRDIARKASCKTTGTKSEVIARLIGHFQTDSDVAGAEPDPIEEPEERALAEQEFTALLQPLTGYQLRSILAKHGLRETGSKAMQINALLESRFAERTLLLALRAGDLSALCEHHDVSASGPKDDNARRLVAAFVERRTRPSA